MSTDRWPLVREHLDAVLDLAPEDRPAYLDRHCAGDCTLRAELEAYLRDEAAVKGFLERPVIDLIAGRRLADAGAARRGVAAPPGCSGSARRWPRG